MFETNGNALELRVGAIPSTVSAVDECVMEVIRNVLLHGVVHWGTMVAVTAFVMMVALRCVHREVVEVVAPLTDHMALLADEKLALFIRENGGWTVFAHAMQKKECSWMYSTISAVASYMWSGDMLRQLAEQLY